MMHNMQATSLAVIKLIKVANSSMFHASASYIMIMRQFSAAAVSAIRRFGVVARCS